MRGDGNKDEAGGDPTTNHTPTAVVSQVWAEKLSPNTSETLKSNCPAEGAADCVSSLRGSQRHSHMTTETLKVQQLIDMRDFSRSFLPINQV